MKKGAVMPSVARHLLFLVENKQNQIPRFALPTSSNSSVIPGSVATKNLLFQKNIRSRFLASLGMTARGTFMSTGGPKAHVKLGMTSWGFSSAR